MTPRFVSRWRARSLHLLAALALPALSACSPVDGAERLCPGIGHHRDPRRPLRPRQPARVGYLRAESASPAPVVVFIYGGGWKDGDKADYRFVAAALAARGFLTVVPDYRLYPEVRFPVFLQDNAAAVAWTRANIARYGGDPRQIFLMGHSAGAYNAAMLTLDRQWLRGHRLDPDRDLKARLASPVHMISCRCMTRNWKSSSPRQATCDKASRSPSPAATRRRCCCSPATADQTVLPTQHRTPRRRHPPRRRNRQQRIYPGVDHLRIIGAMAGLLRWLAPTLADVTGFLNGQTAQPPRSATINAEHPRPSADAE